ncbi:MAG: hypothetical protein U0793_01130 [Gemmataceae bacterium]
MSVVRLKEKGRRLLGRLLKHARNVGLAAALVPLGALPASAAPMEASVISQTSPTSGGTLYQFTVNNLSTGQSGGPPFLTAFMLPLFHTSDVGNIVNPNGWQAQLTSDPALIASLWHYNANNDTKAQQGLFGANPHFWDHPPALLIWSVSNSASDVSPAITPGFGGIPGPGGSLSGFSFVSPFGSTKAPFVAGFDNGQTAIGDPDIPNNPTIQAIPEPASFLVFAGMGAALWLGLKRRRTGEA